MVDVIIKMCLKVELLIETTLKKGFEAIYIDV